jgi:aspartate/tyrosine/aromatic aminotransferase
MTGLFDHIPKGPDDPMNLMMERANADLSPEKIDLGPGVYRGADASKPYVLSAIKRVSVAEYLDSWHTMC